MHVSTTVLIIPLYRLTYIEALDLDNLFLFFASKPLGFQINLFTKHLQLLQQQQPRARRVYNFSPPNFSISFHKIIIHSFTHSLTPTTNIYNRDSDPMCFISKRTFLARIFQWKARGRKKGRELKLTPSSVFSSSVNGPAAALSRLRFSMLTATA